MKKIFKILTCLSLVLTIVLGGCSCSKPSPLSFSYNFFEGKGEPDIGFSEKLTYAVSYVNGGEKYPSLKMSDSLKNKIKGFEADGTYVTELSLNFGANENANIKKSGLYGKNGVLKPSDEFYTLKTTLNYTGKLILNNNNEHVFNDEVVSTAYFLKKANSYMPVYTETTSKTSFILVDETNINIKNEEYNFQTIYNQNDYKIKSILKATGLSVYNSNSGKLVKQETYSQDKIKENTETTSKSYEYTMKTVVDNVQLFFILRNFDISKSGQITTLPVVAPAYGESKTLAFRQDSTAKINLAFTYNGASANTNETIPVKNLSYVLNDVKASGQTQFLTYQTGASVNADTTLAPTVPSRALMIEYAFPLPEYYDMKVLGGLKCSLVSVEVNQ